MIRVKVERKITDQTVRDWFAADKYKAPCDYVCLQDVIGDTLWEGEPWVFDELHVYGDFYIVDEFYDGNGLCILTIKDSIRWESYKAERYDPQSDVTINTSYYGDSKPLYYTASGQRRFEEYQDYVSNAIGVPVEDCFNFIADCWSRHLSKEDAIQEFHTRYTKINKVESYKAERYDPYFDADIDTSDFTPQTPVPLKSLKQGEYFTLKDIPQPKDSQVWVKGEYDKYDKEFVCYKFSDISNGKGMKGSKLVYTDFIF